MVEARLRPKIQQASFLHVGRLGRAVFFVASRMLTIGLSCPNFDQLGVKTYAKQSKLQKTLAEQTAMLGNYLERMDDQQAETRRNRGKDPHDETLFSSAKEREKLLLSLNDMHYLLSKDYPPRATLASVGNRYRLRQRQILALQGMACSAKDIENRKRKEITADGICGKTIYLDGFNVVIILETLLSGGFVFRGLDGCYRDISSVHGSYKRVKQTEDVLIIVGKALHELGLGRVIWIFDAPVSNSGRIKTLCYKIAAENGFAWDVYLDNAPDKFLIAENRLIVTSDAWVLNHCYQWFNLIAFIINNVLNNSKAMNIINPGE